MQFRAHITYVCSVFLTAVLLRFIISVLNLGKFTVYLNVSLTYKASKLKGGKIYPVFLFFFPSSVLQCKLSSLSGDLGAWGGVTGPELGQVRQVVHEQNLVLDISSHQVPTHSLIVPCSLRTIHTIVVPFFLHVSCTLSFPWDLKTFISSQFCPICYVFVLCSSSIPCVLFPFYGLFVPFSNCFLPCRSFALHFFLLFNTWPLFMYVYCLIFFLFTNIFVPHPVTSVTCS